MGGLSEAIPHGALVGIDTVSFIYHIEAVPSYAQIVRPFFELLEQGAFHGITSVISLMEIAVRPLQLMLPEVADDYEVLLANFPHLTVVGIDRRIARRAAELRAQYRLRPADSLHVATALEAGASHFVTNDRAIERVTNLRVLVIDDFR
ncbi:MAG: type II toxin-antitoxin system VapC family toxin [Chloroflexota bacterium]